MATDAERWSELLTAYEQHLDAQEAYLEIVSQPSSGDETLDEPPPMAFVVPHGFPVAPAHLGNRLAELHERTVALAQRSSATLDSLDRPSARRRVNASEATVASMFDRAL